MTEQKKETNLVVTELKNKVEFSPGSSPLSLREYEAKTLEIIDGKFTTRITRSNLTSK